jgi:hypothetical protein
VWPGKTLANYGFVERKVPDFASLTQPRDTSGASVQAAASS